MTLLIALGLPKAFLYSPLLISDEQKWISIYHKFGQVAQRVLL